jgi:ABC-type lipoprotein export system ATPase subunit
MSTAILDRVSKKFGDRIILDNVSYKFLEKEAYVITGESGCGKTTLLNLLASYIQCDSGTVTSSQRVGYLFQDEMLFSNLSVRDNMLIRLSALNAPPESHERLILETLSKLDIHALAERKVSLLSGGERQRVELANILVSDPDLMLLDEPTSRLDEKNKRNVVGLIEDIFADKTIIIVSHDSHLFARRSIRLTLQSGALSYA